MLARTTANRSGTPDQTRALKQLRYRSKSLSNERRAPAAFFLQTLRKIRDPDLMQNPRHRHDRAVCDWNNKLCFHSNLHFRRIRSKAVCSTTSVIFGQRP